ncbi:MAG: Hsp70 family protein [Chloroflexaceae bacterium]|nr:Hsp70 family protein [Chloroflexaceae bacterium]
MIVGIDLGTTFSATALVRDGTPQIMAHGNERIIPSVVSMTPQGTFLIGTPARNQYVVYPDQTVRSIKRHMGTDYTVRLGERTYTPQEISALLLRELKRSLEDQTGETIDRAVITVPAYFSDSARQATHDAGEIAGFTVERIINEPTAAALAYGLNQSEEHQLLAVYDLGGGTFDVSIIEMNDGIVEVRASHGNTQLGGDDFDQRLVDYLAERFRSEHELDPREDRRSLARLNRIAEEAKITLSSQPFVKIREEYLMTTSEGHPLHLDIEIARTEFESMIRDLIEGTVESFDAALKDANLVVDQLDGILFVGGSTRIPLVWDMLYQHTGLEPQTTINPDEAVALGAAVQAAIIEGEPIDAILVDVTPHSLGIEVAAWEFGRLINDLYSVIIHRNTTVPTSRSEVYSAMTPTQTVIQIKVYQGEHPVASHNTLLGEFLFEDLKPEISGEPPRITVHFDFDVNGILHVSAVDRGSGKQASMSVTATRAHLSASDIARARDELDVVEVSPWDIDISDGEASGFDNMEILALLARAKRMVAHLSGVEAADMQTLITALEDAIKRDDDPLIEQHAEELLDMLYEIDEDDDDDDDDDDDNDDDDDEKGTR